MRTSISQTIHPIASTSQTRCSIASPCISPAHIPHAFQFTTSHLPGANARAAHHRCRVTNDRKEVSGAKEQMAALGLEEDSDFVMIDPDHPIPNPELGPLERRVSITFEEALERDEVDPEAEHFWFTEPKGGWQREKRKLKKLEVAATDGIDVLLHEDLEGRQPISAFQEGQVLTGTIVKHMLYHGVQVDFGAHWDGLITARGLDQWQHFAGEPTLVIGEQIECKIFALRDESKFRFPVQLVPTDADLYQVLPRPEEHIAPVDLRHVKPTDAQQFAESVGRGWTPQKVVVEAKELSLDEKTGRSRPVEYTEDDYAKIDDIVGCEM